MSQLAYTLQALRECWAVPHWNQQIEASRQYTLRVLSGVLIAGGCA